MITVKNRIKKHLGKEIALSLVMIMAVLCFVGTNAYAAEATPVTSESTISSVILDDYGTLDAGQSKSGTFTVSWWTTATIYYGCGGQANGSFTFNIISESDTVTCGDMKSTTVSLQPGTYRYSITNNANGAESYSFTVITG